MIIDYRKKQDMNLMVYTHTTTLYFSTQQSRTASRATSKRLEKFSEFNQGTLDSHINSSVTNAPPIEIDQEEMKMINNLNIFGIGKNISSRYRKVKSWNRS